MKYSINLLLSLCLLTPLWADVTIHIDHFAFSPAQVTIVPGETVTWINDDPNMNYAISSSDYSMMTNKINYQQTFIKTFHTPGTYAYFCRDMPVMQGVVVVQPVNQYINDKVKTEVKAEVKAQLKTQQKTQQ